MARDGIDVLVAPNVSGSWGSQHASVRYLTTMGANCAPVAAVFPREGEVTGVVGPVPAKEFWLGWQDWVTDVRPTFFGMYEGVAERLKELNIGKGRVGITGLAALPRAPEGIAPHGAVLRIKDACPEAEIVNAQPLIEEARYIKSEEEIACLRESVRLVERAVEVLEQEARPGVPEAVVYARMLASMGELGGEWPTFLIFSAGHDPQPARGHFQPTMRKLQAGDVIACEIESRWAGYIGQITLTAVLGKASAEYREMFEIQQEALRRCLEHLRPGAKVEDFIALAEDVAKGTSYRSQIILHGRGLGDDPPIVIFGTEFGGQAQRMKNWRVEENACFVVKPLVTGPGRTVCWGDSVVVRASGAERLGTRPPALIEIA